MKVCSMPSSAQRGKWARFVKSLGVDTPKVASTLTYEEKCECAINTIWETLEILHYHLIRPECIVLTPIVRIALLDFVRRMNGRNLLSNNDLFGVSLQIGHKNMIILERIEYYSSDLEVGQWVPLYIPYNFDK